MVVTGGASLVTSLGFFMKTAVILYVLERNKIHRRSTGDQFE
jgi:hypothetical protein